MHVGLRQFQGSTVTGGAGTGVALALVLCLVLPASRASAEVYKEPDVFIAESFTGEPPAPETVWLTGDLQKAVGRILGHDYKSLRVRYWRQGARTAWILEEIGKERPITTGLVIDNGDVANIDILIYRESRGWEVRHDFFTNQFKGMSLENDLTLTGGVDGISGATLSVHAVTNLARMALRLHDAVTKKESE